MKVQNLELGLLTKHCLQTRVKPRNSGLQNNGKPCNSGKSRATKFSFLRCLTVKIVENPAIVEKFGPQNPCLVKNLQNSGMRKKTKPLNSGIIFWGQRPIN